MDISQRLQSIYRKELQLSKIEISPSLNFDISFDNNQLSFNSSQGSGKKTLDRAILHQIGSRIYGTDLDYKQIVQNIQDQIQKNSNAFSSAVREALIKHDSIILLDQNRKNIYGLVSSKFEFIDPVFFRNTFISHYQHYGTPYTEKQAIGTTRYGEIYEKFYYNKMGEFGPTDEPVQYAVVLIYGLNNGYSSYRMALNRIIKICSNGLTTEERKEFARLKHTKNPDINGFVLDINSTIKNYNFLLQEQIKKAKIRTVDPLKYKELFDRLHAAEIVKNRVRDRFELETKKDGDHEWSLAQAFTHVGTHFYGESNDKHHEALLISCGSEIVDSSLTDFLSAPVQKIRTEDSYSFGSLLPNKYNLN